MLPPQIRSQKLLKERSMGEGMEDTREKFLRIFANVPEKVRGEDVIAVVDDKPFTWNTAMIEVKNDTVLGKEILKHLEKMGIV